MWVIKHIVFFNQLCGLSPPDADIIDKLILYKAAPEIQAVNERMDFMCIYSGHQVLLSVV